uniref:Uncharacterized protein n=1 Tax=Helianthus annuus TaxID=4232 RepID=A0A251S4F1_HELAN
MLSDSIFLFSLTMSPTLIIIPSKSVTGCFFNRGLVFVTRLLLLSFLSTRSTILLLHHYGMLPVLKVVIKSCTYPIQIHTAY